MYNRIISCGISYVNKTPLRCLKLTKREVVPENENGTLKKSNFSSWDSVMNISMQK